MDEREESASDASDIIITPEDDLDGFPAKAVSIVEDLTGKEQSPDYEGQGDEDQPAAPLQSGDEKVMIKPRPYQREMLEKSLKRNIIVAMDTGSGKTHISVMRILHELERCPSDQFIWFLAPTVSLCEQQYNYIKSQVTAVDVKFLSGADNVDRWTEASHWDTVLLNVKVVVSTYQILLDALSHGFVQMSSLALIIFDEAHNCVDKHPGAKLMSNFYHKRKATGQHVPHILGLTASPVMKSSTSSLTKIEETLDAICRTPSKHRAQLRLLVKLPVMSQVYYIPTPAKTPSDLMRALSEACMGLKLAEDPYYLHLLKNETESGRRRLVKVRMSQKTDSSDQMKSFKMTAQKIGSELGTWAADHYISEVVGKVMSLVKQSQNILGLWDVSSAERQYLAKALRNMPLSFEANQDIVPGQGTSDKVEKMIDALLDSESTSSGIIFVQERAAAVLLAKLISVHPRTRHKFRIGVVVGTSVSGKRSGRMGDLIDPSEHKDTLVKFKDGKIDLVVATNVLEEGIDIPACNLVLCFQKPANLKSFVQRRGRARHHNSRLVLLLDPLEDKVDHWQQLEADMRRMYEDEMRTLQELLFIEDSEEHDERVFHILSTNALLDLDNAISHLYHFCAALPANEYADLRPEFICTRMAGDLITAKVILPISVHENVRTATSLRPWKSEKNAIKDAAFEAYVNLYRAGLVSDNLLPLLRHDAITDELMTSAVETRASIVSVNELVRPWVEAAKSWMQVGQGTGEAASLHTAKITIEDLDMDLYMPFRLPAMRSFPVYWDNDTKLQVFINNNGTLPVQGAIEKSREDTLTLLRAGFGARFGIDHKFLPVQFASRSEKPLQELQGCSAAPLDSEEATSLSSQAVVRDSLDPNIMYTFRALLHSKPDSSKVQLLYPGFEETPLQAPHVSLRRVTRRDDFLHGVTDVALRSMKDFSYVLPLSRCLIDRMPVEYVQLGRLIPSIMHKIEVTLIAQRLSESMLQTVQVSDLDLVLTAISASSAREASNYQRLEFLGDSLLKTCASIQIISENPLWHEGYLSAKKDRLVSNSRLSRAAMEIGLDEFIITKAFTGYKWRPQYVEDLLSLPSQVAKRDMSTKVLADVVEALIGAATVDGGVPKALACMQTFLPEIQWRPLEERRLFLYQRAPNVDLPTTLQPLESLIGYTFTKKSLLIEAMTHASCNSGSGSLERLEFLGDSILDNIIVNAMWAVSPPLSHYQMHLLRTALVNADFLAYICMEWSLPHTSTSLSVDETTHTISEVHKESSWPLWRFMRHMSPKLGSEQHITATQHSLLRTRIKSSIESGSSYPWALLSQLRAHKYYSDIIESLLGAVYLDSNSFDECKAIVERMGILQYFERIIREDVHVLHPKEELGMLAVEKNVKYVVEKGGNCWDGVRQEMVQGLICTVLVGDREVVSVEGNVEKGVLRTMAAERAVEILKGEGKEKEVVNLDSTSGEEQRGRAGDIEMNMG